MSLPRSASPCVTLLHYNATTYGSPWVLGYQAVNGHLHNLGFGLRGFRTYSASGEPIVHASPFTLHTAFAHLAERSWDIAANVMPGFLLVPLIFLGAIHRYPFRWATVGAFLILPALYFFYFYSEARFYVGLLPLVFVGTAMIIEHVYREHRAIGRWLIALALGGNLLLSVLWLTIGAVTYRSRNATFDQVARAGREHGRVVVFVADSSTETRGLFYELYWFNVDRFPGPVVVARDLGERNAELLRRLPGYVPFRIERHGDGSTQLRPADSEAAGTG